MKQSLSRSFLAATLTFGLLASSGAGADENQPTGVDLSRLDQVSPVATQLVCASGVGCGNINALIKDGICPIDIAANMPGPIGALASKFAGLPFRQFMPPTIMGRVISAGILQAQNQPVKAEVPRVAEAEKPVSYAGATAAPAAVVTMAVTLNTPRI